MEQLATAVEIVEIPADDQAVLELSQNELALVGGAGFCLSFD